MKELLAVGLVGMWLLGGSGGRTRPSVVAGEEVTAGVAGLAVSEAGGWRAMCFLESWRQPCRGDCSQIALFQIVFEVGEAALVVCRPVVTVLRQEEMQTSVTMSGFVVAKAAAGSMVGVVVEMVSGVAVTVRETKLTAIATE